MYYVFEIADGDSKIKGKGVYSFETRNEALASFHKKLGTAMGSELYTEELIICVDSFGVVLAKEHYAVETETEIETETA